MDGASQLKNVKKLFSELVDLVKHAKVNIYNTIRFSVFLVIVFVDYL